MKLKSLLPNTTAGVGVGLGELIAIYLIYQHAVPPMADVRSVGQANDENIEAARRHAALQSAGLLGIVFLLTRDINAFIVGGLGMGAVDYSTKHHNAINPGSGKWDSQGDGGNVAPRANVYSLPDYSQSEAM